MADLDELKKDIAIIEEHIERNDKAIDSLVSGLAKIADKIENVHSIVIKMESQMSVVNKVGFFVVCGVLTFAGIVVKTKLGF